MFKKKQPNIIFPFTFWQGTKKHAFQSSYWWMKNDKNDCYICLHLISFWSIFNFRAEWMVNKKEKVRAAGIVDWTYPIGIITIHIISVSLEFFIFPSSCLHLFTFFLEVTFLWYHSFDRFCKFDTSSRSYNPTVLAEA